MEADKGSKGSGRIEEVGDKEDKGDKGEDKDKGGGIEQTHPCLLVHDSPLLSSLSTRSNASLFELGFLLYQACYSTGAGPTVKSFRAPPVSFVDRAVTVLAPERTRHPVGPDVLAQTFHAHATRPLQFFYLFSTPGT